MVVPFIWTNFINFVNVFSLFRHYLVLEKGMGHLNKFESYPVPKGCYLPSMVDGGVMDFTTSCLLLCKCYIPNLVEISPIVFEKKMTWVTQVT